jgi:hypothetical protein
VYVAEYRNHILRRVSASGSVTTLAGTAGVSGFADGQGPAVKFKSLTDVAVDASGNLYVADCGNYLVRKAVPFPYAGVLLCVALFELFTDRSLLFRCRVLCSCWESDDLPRG